MKKKNENNKQKIEEELIQVADAEIEDIDFGEKNSEEDKIGQLENQLRRAVADYQNLEKRTDENRIQWALTSNKSLIMKLLPILDDLFLASKHIQDVGLNLSVQKFLDILKEEGIEEIETKDHEFDPNTMECVTVSEGEENKVLEEVRKGYIMNEEVLRPAQVIVGGANKLKV